MVKNTLRSLLLFFLLTLQGLTQSANIIFDLDGVLMHKSNLSFMWQVGLSNIVGFYNPFGLDQTLLKFLDHVEPHSFDTPYVIHNKTVLPKLMCDWQCGLKTTAEIRAILADAFIKKADFFSTRWELNIIEASTSIIFSPEKFSKTIIPIKAGIKLLKKCYKQVDDLGNRINKIFILSNFDPETFEYLRTNKKLKKMFSLCDGVAISGHAHCMKPQPEIFHYLFSQYSINPDEELTVFIDDQEANIESARNLRKQRLYPLLCKNLDYKPIEKALNELGILADN